MESLEKRKWGSIFSLINFDQSNQGYFESFKAWLLMVFNCSESELSESFSPLQTSNTTIRLCTCAESESILWWLKLRSCSNHYTTIATVFWTSQSKVILAKMFFLAKFFWNLWDPPPCRQIPVFNFELKGFADSAHVLLNVLKNNNKYFRKTSTGRILISHFLAWNKFRETWNTSILLMILTFLIRWL